MSNVKDGDRVRVHYVGRLTNGEVFDTSENREPLEFTAGGDEVIPGVSRAVVGMGAGGRKTVRVPPAEGYGERDPNLVQTLSRAMLPDDASVGDQLRATSDGQEFAVWIRELGPQEAVVDANHPLAGETLEFDLHLVSVGDA